MNDYLVKAYAFNGTVRIYAATTTKLVEEARKIHQSYPAASAAFGRLLTTSLIMGAMYSEDQSLTIRVDGNGPIGKMITKVDAHGHVKGTLENPQVHYSYKDKLAVGMVVGNQGYIHVTKDLKIRDVFTSSSEIQTGEIAEDFTYYFAKSEQIPSSVGLGVLVNENNEVFASGGFILQVMPGVKEDTITQIEENISSMKPISELINDGKTPEEIIQEITKGDHEFVEEMPLSYQCDCSKERFENGLSTLDIKELDSMIDDLEPIEVTCDFCKTHYHFSIDEIKAIKKNKEEK
ncbi:Hsp33 family molecular chaperone HslO [Hujiaoplasma nucleasis]|uniref:33 kDa chaperonin n=1 Tax=Hujiaoplasma nucleasis TaxID=2725268 RepID=A0A7L6N7G6_9MOLU|nr:Hsp33 family molecular chaperone HslO [Hujiaoplasma nucleasis]QLY40474.1 Hsp33 family molecular chaperone HslO [Hujiaoplasma nucleasis]